MFLSVLTAIFAALFSPQAQAEAASFQCNAGPDLPSYQIKRIDRDTYEMRVYFPWSTSIAPIHSGDITAELIPHLQRKAQFVEKLGNSYTALFKKDQCLRRNKDGLYNVHCFIRGWTKFNGADVKGLSFYTFNRNVTTLACENGKCGPIEHSETYVGVEVGVPATKHSVQLYDFARTYPGEDCSATASFWN